MLAQEGYLSFMTAAQKAHWVGAKDMSYDGSMLSYTWRPLNIGTGMLPYD